MMGLLFFLPSHISSVADDQTDHDVLQSMSLQFAVSPRWYSVECFSSFFSLQSSLRVYNIDRIYYS